MCQMIFFVDIDGTIKKSGLPLSYAMHQALQHLRKQGHELIYCTGRTLLEVPFWWKCDGVIACFGHQIVYHKKILYACAIDTQVILENKNIFGFGWSHVYVTPKAIFSNQIYKLIIWDKGYRCIYPHKMDKGKAITFLRKAYLNNETICVGIGNSLDDIPMFQAVDVKVAVGSFLSDEIDIQLKRWELSHFLKGVGKDATYFNYWRR